MLVEGGREVLAEAPTVRGAIVVDHAHLVVAEAVHAVFVQEELGILDQEVPHLRLAVVEDESAGMAAVGEVEGVSVAARGGLAVQEVHALIAEIAARVVVDDVQDDGETVYVAQVDQRLELIHFAAQVGYVVA